MKILITGASDGIGKSTALELASANHELILLARDLDKLQKVKEECEMKGALNVQIFKVDLRNSSEIDAFVNEITELDGIVNNAGIWQKKAQLDEISEEEIINVINTNLTGLILLTRKILPLIRKSSNGIIINISSRSGYSAQQGQVIYSATKYGVRGFTEVLREDLSESGIRVAGVYQGGTNTQMFNKAGEGIPDDKLSSFIPSEQLAKIIAFIISLPKGVWLSEVRVEKK